MGGIRREVEGGREEGRGGRKGRGREPLGGGSNGRVEGGRDMEGRGRWKDRK